MKASFCSENSPESGRLVLLYKNLHLSWAGDQAHGPEHWLRAWIFGCWVIPPVQWWETESYLQSSEKLSHTASPVRNWVIPPVQWWETESYRQSSGEKLSHTSSPVVRNWVIPPVQWWETESYLQSSEKQHLKLPAILTCLNTEKISSERLQEMRAKIDKRGLYRIEKLLNSNESKY
jgi:hypothetical protein